MVTKPRILNVIDHSDSGGTQVQLAIRMVDLQDRFEFSVAVLGRKGELSEKYQQLGLPVYELGRGRNRWNPGAFFSLLKLVRKIKPNIVHAHLFKSIVLSPLVARLTGTDCILHDHSGLNRASLQFYFPNKLNRIIYSLALRFAIRLSTHVVVFTRSAQQDYLGEFDVPQAKIDFLPNSIDLDTPNIKRGNYDIRKELKLSDHASIIIMVGRLSPEKDWPTFIKVAERFPDPEKYAFIAVGSGYLETSLRETVMKQGLSNIVFLGERKDVPALLSQADAFLLTSRQEAFGNVILEAMAAGCPVIASLTPGPSSIIEHGRTGVLVKIGDVDAFAANLEAILADPQKVEEMIHAARLSIEEFTPEKVSAKLAGIYTLVLSNRKERKL
jgi:glycosyltransferase involved in cell wall biosynthesis